MDKRNIIENDLVDMRLMSPAEWSIVHQRIVCEARTARAAAMQKALMRVPGAGGRLARLLSSIFRAIGVAYAAHRRRRLETRAASELKAFSDRALSDLGIARSEIEQRVRLPTELSGSRA
jgi:uncharacterized protein YjiS (DUF1127 family)